MQASKIVAAVLKYREQDQNVFLSKGSRAVVYTKQLCSYFLRKYTTMTFEEISTFLGAVYRAAATAWYRTITNLIDVDTVVLNDIQSIQKIINEL